MFHSVLPLFASRLCMTNKRPSVGLQTASLDSLSLHMQVSFLKKRCGGHQSSPFIEIFAPKRVFQSPELSLDDRFLERAISLSRCESTRVSNAIFHRIEYRATFAAGPTEMMSGLVFLCSGNKQTNALVARFPTLRQVHEKSHAGGFDTCGPHRP
jgi:hypothetical protein